jgi:hypothetical protein
VQIDATFAIHVRTLCRRDSLAPEIFARLLQSKPQDYELHRPPWLHPLLRLADDLNELRVRMTRYTKSQEPSGAQSGALSHSFECVMGVLPVPSARITKMSALPSTPLVAWTIHLPSGE